MADSTISVSPAYKSYGVQRIGSVTPQTFRITNTSADATLILGSIGSSSIPFWHAGASIAGSIIDPGAYVDTTYVYQPTELGISTDWVPIPSNDPNDATYRINLDGTCSQPVIVITPSSEPFGNVANLSTIDQTVKVSNSGNLDMTVGTITGITSPYTLQSDSVSGATIIPDATNNMVLRYHPTAQGASTSTITIPNNDTTQTFVMDGTSIPAVVITPATKNFGNKANLSTTDQIVSVVNHSNGDATFAAMTGFTAPFTLVSNAVSGATIAGGATKTFTVRFHPTTYGAFDSTVTIPNNDSTQTFIANGLSQEADISVTPAYKSFGAKLVRYGTFGAPIMEYCDITCTNAGNINLKMQEIDPPSNMSFFLSNDNISRRTLTPGSSGTIRVSQRPATFGDESCAIIFNSTDPDTAAYHFNVYGTGLGA